MNPRITKIAHNLAFESVMLYKEFGIVVQGSVYDTMCAAQMIDAARVRALRLRQSWRRSV